MAYTLTNITDDIRNYTEVDSSVLSTAVINRFIQNAENRVYREVDSDDNRNYATSNLAAGIDMLRFHLILEILDMFN